jgi:hypothetical protein
MPHPWQFEGGLLQTLRGMFIDHSEIVPFLVHRSNADKSTPPLGLWSFKSAKSPEPVGIPFTLARTKCVGSGQPANDTKVSRNTLVQLFCFLSSAIIGSRYEYQRTGISGCLSERRRQ